MMAAVRSFVDRPLALLFLFALMSHGSLFFNDGLYFDGWLIYGLETKGDYTQLLKMFSELGLPGLGYFHAFLSLVPLPIIFTYRLVTFFGIFGAAAFLYKILGYTGVFSRMEALFAACFFCCFTAFQANIDVTVATYVVAYAFFLSGIYLAFIVISESSPVVGWRPLLSAVLLFASFHVMSCIFLYAVLLPVALVLRPSRDWLGRIRKTWSWQFLIFSAIPCVFLIIKYKFWVSYGPYADYNRPRFDIGNPIGLFIAYVKNAVFAQFWNAIGVQAAFPVLAAVVVVVVGTAVLALRRSLREAPEREGARLSPVALIGYASLCLIFVAAPYVLVQKIPESSGWETRHALLVNLPVALMVLGLGRGVAAFSSSSRVLVTVCAVMLLSLFSTATMVVYMHWEMRAIKDHATIEALRIIPKAQIAGVSYVYVDDAKYVPNTGVYTFVDYAGIFDSAWGDGARIGDPEQYGNDLPKVMKSLSSRRRYFLANVKDGGCSAILKINFTPRRSSEPATIAEYAAASFNGASARRAFLLANTSFDWSDLSGARVAELTRTVKAFEDFKAATGSYPKAPASPAGVMDVSHPEGWVQQLVPKYIDRIPGDQKRRIASDSKFLFLSDGRNFKIIAHGPEDVSCVQNKRPDMTDPRRATYAYGFWTDNARMW